MLLIKSRGLTKFLKNGVMRRKYLSRGILNINYGNENLERLSYNWGQLMLFNKIKNKCIF